MKCGLLQLIFYIAMLKKLPSTGQIFLQKNHVHILEHNFRKILVSSVRGPYNVLAHLTIVFLKGVHPGPKDPLVCVCLVHLSHRLNVSFCEHRMSSSVCQRFLQTTFLPKPLGGILPNFTGMILRWSPFKVVKKFPFHADYWLPWQPKGKTRNLVKNYGADLKIIWHKWPLGDPLPRFLELI